MLGTRDRAMNNIDHVPYSCETENEVYPALANTKLASEVPFRRPHLQSSPKGPNLSPIFHSTLYNKTPRYQLVVFITNVLFQIFYFHDEPSFLLHVSLK